MVCILNAPRPQQAGAIGRTSYPISRRLKPLKQVGLKILNSSPNIGVQFTLAISPLLILFTKSQIWFLGINPSLNQITSATVGIIS